MADNDGNEDTKIKVVFAPGSFDAFNGTQEELDEIVKMITEMAESGDFESFGSELTEEEFDELPEDLKAKLLLTMQEELEDAQDKRVLN